MAKSIAVALVAVAVLAGAAAPSGAQQGVEITIDPVGTFTTEGNATVTVSVACGDAVGAGIIEVSLSQQVGRVSTVRGSGFADVFCSSPDAIAVDVLILPTNGQFRGGRARADALITGADFRDETGAAIRLRG